MEVLDSIDSYEKGAYILLISLKVSNDIRIGSLGIVRFDSGYYAYVGSAMAGLKQRILRHLRKDKKLHWHIDYLLEKANISNVIVCKSVNRLECGIAGELGKVFKPIYRFGASDCRCFGHLFYSPSGFDKNIMRVLESTGLNPQLVMNDQDDGN